MVFFFSKNRKGGDAEPVKQNLSISPRCPILVATSNGSQRLAISLKLLSNTIVLHLLNLGKYTSFVISVCSAIFIYPMMSLQVVTSYMLSPVNTLYSMIVVIAWFWNIITLFSLYHLNAHSANIIRLDWIFVLNIYMMLNFGGAPYSTTLVILW